MSATVYVVRVTDHQTGDVEVYGPYTERQAERVAERINVEAADWPDGGHAGVAPLTRWDS